MLKKIFLFDLLCLNKKSGTFARYFKRKSNFKNINLNYEKDSFYVRCCLRCVHDVIL